MFKYVLLIGLIYACVKMATTLERKSITDYSAEGWKGKSKYVMYVVHIEREGCFVLSL